MISAHIAGLPIEETFATVAPLAGIIGVLVGASLRGLTTSLRRRKPNKPTR